MLSTRTRSALPLRPWGPWHPLMSCRPSTLVQCSRGLRATSPQQHEVTLFTKHDCPLCHKAKAVLERVRIQALAPPPLNTTMQLLAGGG
jgi:hypothetical protein